MNEFDIEVISLEYEKFLIELGLDIKNPIHTAAAHALTSSKHLFERGKKTSAKLYGGKLDKLTEQARQLSSTLQSLDRTYKDCLMFSLRNQHNIRISNSDQIDKFIKSLSEASESVKEIKINPIPDGYYNQFLFYFVDNLLRTSRMFPSYFFVQYFYRKRNITEIKVNDFLIDTWKNYYADRAREVAIWIIQSQLNTAKDKRNAQKAVDKHLDIIVNERAKHNAKLILRSYNELKNYEKIQKLGKQS